MTTFVLVHSPLVGPRSWSAVATELGDGGRRVLVPSLRAVADAGAGGPFWSRHVDAAVDGVRHDERVLLVGHSGAGALLPAIGERLGARLAGYLFVDAGLPACGLSWAATAPPALVERLKPTVQDGYVSPWHEWFGGVDALSGLLPDAAQRAEFVSELDPLAWEMLEEPRPACAGWPTAPVGFLLLSEAYQGEADAAEERGWPTLRIVGHHLSTVTDARTVAEQLLKLESRVGGQSKAGR